MKVELKQDFLAIIKVRDIEIIINKQEVYYELINLLEKCEEEGINVEELEFEDLEKMVKISKEFIDTIFQNYYDNHTNNTFGEFEEYLENKKKKRKPFTWIF